MTQIKYNAFRIIKQLNVPKLLKPVALTHSREQEDLTILKKFLLLL